MLVDSSEHPSGLFLSFYSWWTGHFAEFKYQLRLVPRFLASKEHLKSPLKVYHCVEIGARFLTAIPSSSLTANVFGPLTPRERRRSQCTTIHHSCNHSLLQKIKKRRQAVLFLIFCSLRQSPDDCRYWHFFILSNWRFRLWYYERRVSSEMPIFPQILFNCQDSTD